jgi:hypothetical protein
MATMMAAQKVDAMVELWGALSADNWAAVSVVASAL